MNDKTDMNSDVGSGLNLLHKFRITVLLIDDQPMIAEAVRRSLTSEEDIDFHYCQDPTKAIQMALEVKPTVILQDLVMPEIDGLMMVRFFRVKPETAQVPIIVLSTKEQAEIKSQAFSLGANDYLVKLPDKIELIARIRHHSKAYISELERDEAFRALKESERKLAEANKILQKLSSLDGLTGIPNRRSFDEVLLKEWNRSKRHSNAISLIMLDIDFFKLYNDHYGHQGGDDCLKRVATALKNSLHRETDMLARYGGEEFSAILPDTNIEGALKLAENMRSNVQSNQIPHEKSKVSDYVSISIGVASTVPSQDSTPPDILIAAADQALYKAKEEGRNRVAAGKISTD